MDIFMTDEEYIDLLHQRLRGEESSKIAWRNRASELEKERDDAMATVERTKTMLKRYAPCLSCKNEHLIGSYEPCRSCLAHPGDRPLWELKED